MSLCYYRAGVQRDVSLRARLPLQCAHCGYSRGLRLERGLDHPRSLSLPTPTRLLSLGIDGEYQRHMYHVLSVWIWINLAFYYTFRFTFFFLDLLTHLHHVSLNKDRHKLVGALVVTRQKPKISGFLVTRATKFCTLKPNTFSLLNVLLFLTNTNLFHFKGNEQKGSGKNMWYLNVLTSFIEYCKHITLNIL
jgi:hypothetical protein